MPTYAYRAVDHEGRRTRGRLTAATENAAVRDLETRGLLALDVREAESDVDARSGGLGSRGAVLEFTRGMAALLPAGMPLARALDASARTSPAGIRPALADVRERVRRGDELAAALREHPRLFSSLYVGIIRSGERTGALDAAFRRLGAHLEREQELRSKLLSMSIYPLVLAIVGIVSVAVLLVFVLPRFAELLIGSGSTIPTTTAFVLAVATAAQQYWYLLAVLPLVFALALAWMRKTEPGRRAGSRLLLSLPLLGRWRRQAIGARFARMTGELLGGGSALLSALADARDDTPDPIARDMIDTVRARVREGSSLTHAIRGVAFFPDSLEQLSGLGEEAGRLADFLLKAADLLERRTERALERLVALAEPAMIIVFGGLVALVALALLQAIYGMNPGTLR